MPPPIRPSLDEIRAKLQLALPAASIELEDESHLHAGHAGAAGGAGHYKVKVRAPNFEGLSTLKRHRLVYDALQEWMPHRIHALSIETLV